MSNTPRERRQAKLARQGERLRALDYYTRCSGTWALDGREAFERDELRAKIDRARMAQMRHDRRSNVQLGLEVAA